MAAGVAKSYYLKVMPVQFLRCSFIIQRIAKENVKKYGRQIGKMAHANPTLVFDTFLAKIQVHNNFIEPVIEALKYMTPLAFDVMASSLVESLAELSHQRKRSKEVDLLFLRSMSQFTGQVFKKFDIDMTGLIQVCHSSVFVHCAFDSLPRAVRHQ